MAWLQDKIDRYIWPVKRNYPDDGLPTINGSILNSILYGDGYTDEPVTIRKGLRVSIAQTCVRVRAGTIAALPIGIFKEQGKNKIAATDHAAYYPLAHEANSYMSSANFFYTIMVHADGWGNAYAYINRDSRRNPVSFDIWEPWEVTISRENGDLFYTYEGRTVPSRDVLHFRWYSLDGICGLSPILENQDTFGMAIKLKRYASLILGAQPPGVLSYEGNLTPDQKAENKKEWKGGSRGDVKVLSGKWHYDPVILQADQTQFNQTKEINEREITAIYQTPPPFVQNFQRQTYSNAEQSDLSFAKHTVTGLVTMIEKELNMKLFFEREKSTTFVKMNMNGLLRGDLTARKEFYQAMVNTGIYNRNEARSLEDLNPYPGGDDYLVQGAMVPADMLRKKYESEVLPSSTEPVKPKYVNGHSYAN